MSPPLTRITPRVCPHFRALRASATSCVYCSCSYLHFTISRTLTSVAFVRLLSSGVEGTPWTRYPRAPRPSVMLFLTALLSRLRLGVWLLVESVK